MEVGNQPLYTVRPANIDMMTGHEVTDEEMNRSKTAVRVCLAYNDEGIIIGAPSLAQILCDEHGIKPESIEGIGVCCIGYSAKENKWYGWSDSEFCGFAVGSRIEFGHVAYRPNSRSEFIQMLWQKYEGNPQYKNIKFMPEVDGITVSYDVESPDMIDASVEAQYEALKLEHGILDMQQLRSPKHEEWFMPYPEVWGKGEWEAKTIEDAKTMAVDYVESLIY